MAAAGIGPQSGAVVFFHCTLLQEHFTFVIEDKNTERPVQYPEPMRFHLAQCTYGLVFFIDQYDLLLCSHSLFIY
jgi:hypothetical protein